MAQNITNEQLFEFMTKMYSDLGGKIQSMDGKIQGMDGKIQGMDGKIQGMDGKIQSMDGKIQSMDGKIQGMGERMEEGFKEVKSEIKELKKRVMIIEQEHGEKLDLLFDGYKQNSDKLDRIENEVTKHEEIILKRVR